MMMMTTWCETAIQGRSFPVTASFWTESVSFTVYIIWDMYISYIILRVLSHNFHLPEQFSDFPFMSSCSPFPGSPKRFQMFQPPSSPQAILRPRNPFHHLSKLGPRGGCLSPLVWLMKCWVTWIKILLLDHERPWSETCFISGHWLNENWICSNFEHDYFLSWIK